MLADKGTKTRRLRRPLTIFGVLLFPLLCATPVLAGPLTPEVDALESRGATLAEGETRASDAYVRGNFAEVLRLLRGSPEENSYGSNSEALQVAATIRLGRIQEGLEGWEDLAASDRVSTDSSVLVADAFLDEGEVHRAATVLRRGLLDSPSSPKLLRRLGLTQADLGQHDQALLYLEAALRQRDGMVPSGADLDGLSRSYLATQQYLKAVDVYERFPSNDGSLRDLATAHAMLARGELDEATDVISEIHYPLSAEFLFRARLLLLANKPNEALAALNRVPASLSGSPVLSGTKLLALLSAGLTSDASQFLRELEQTGVLQDPVPAAIAAAAEGNLELAATYLSRAPLPLPDLASVPIVLESLSNTTDIKLLALAYFRYRLGFFVLAREATVDMESPLPLLIAADSARRMKLNQVSEREYSKLTSLLPEAVSLRYQHALVLSELGEATRAEKLLKAVLDERPDYIAAAISRAAIQRSSGDLDGAIDTLTFSLNFQPNRASLLAALAGYLLQSGEFSFAESVIQRLRSVEGSASWSTSQLAGRLALERGEAAIAKESLERAVAVKMNAPELLSDLAKTYDLLEAKRRASAARELQGVLFN